MIGANLRFAWLEQATLKGAALMCCDFTCSQCAECIFQNADLTEAKLTNARFIRANGRDSTLVNCDCSSTFLLGADLTGANLDGAQLRHANLSLANLQNARLGGAVFDQTELIGTKFDNATVGGTIFASIDLRSAVGLENVVHESASTVGVESILESNDAFKAFLRGTGASDLFVDYLSCWLNQPIEFGSCFLAHPSAGEDFVHLLSADLQKKGLRCHFVSELHPRDNAVYLNDRLLLVLCKGYDVDSELQTLVRSTVQRQLEEKRQIIFALVLDEESVHSSRVPAPTFNFTGWRNRNSYEVALLELVGALSIQDVGASTGA